MDGPLTVEYCLKKANEYLARAENMQDGALRKECLKMADELMELARTLSAQPNSQ
jgi:hypothetical protein